MNAVNEQRAVADEIAEIISNPAYAGAEAIDDVSQSRLMPMLVEDIDIFPQDELKAELDELEQEELNDRLRGADHVPLHQPGGRVEEGKAFLRCVAPNVLRTIYRSTSCASSRGGRRRGRTQTAASPTCYVVEWHQ